MSAFPTAHSTVYRNAEGEPLGWSDETYYEPDPYDDDNPEGPPPMLECPSCHEVIGEADDLGVDDLLYHNENCYGPWVDNNPPGFPETTLEEYR